MGRIPHHPQIEKHYTTPPEWRMNPVTGQWVIIAPERAARPVPESEPAVSHSTPETCPFCAGYEERTPPELGAIRPAGGLPNAPDWRVRCVPNAFAAVRGEVLADPPSDGFFNRAAGVGRHELIIECAGHETNLARLGVEQLREVAWMWRERVLDASRDPNLKYAQLFKNHGPEAGASVEHAHSQLLATPLVPVTISKEMEYAAKFHREHKACIYCELLRREAREGSRLVIESPKFHAFTAFAARQPFETWIVPKTHGSQFELMSAAETDGLGTILWTILRKMDAVLDGPAYNLVFHSAPFHEGQLAYYHWRLDVLPRLSQIAGYEWGTGSHATPILPEDAALVLRETVA